MRERRRNGQALHSMNWRRVHEGVAAWHTRVTVSTCQHERCTRGRHPLGDCTQCWHAGASDRSAACPERRLTTKMCAATGRATELGRTSPSNALLPHLLPPVAAQPQPRRTDLRPPPMLLPVGADLLPAATPSPPPPPVLSPAAAARWRSRRRRSAPAALLPPAGPAALQHSKQRAQAPAAQRSTEVANSTVHGRHVTA